MKTSLTRDSASKVRVQVEATSDEVEPAETVGGPDTRDEASLLVGEEDGRLIGTVIAGWDGWRGGIYRLAVVPECRRRGVGQALVLEAERRLAARGARRLNAMVARDEAHARAFWDAAPGWDRDARWQRYTRDL